MENVDLLKLYQTERKKCGIDIRTNPYHPLDRNDLGFVFITYHKSLHLDNISNKDHVSNEGV